MIMRIFCKTHVFVLTISILLLFLGQYSAVLCSTVQFSALQCSAVQCLLFSLYRTYQAHCITRGQLTVGSGMGDRKLRWAARNFNCLPVF